MKSIYQPWTPVYGCPCTKRPAHVDLISSELTSRVALLDCAAHGPTSPRHPGTPVYERRLLRGPHGMMPKAVRCMPTGDSWLMDQHRSQFNVSMLKRCRALGLRDLWHEAIQCEAILGSELVSRRLPETKQRVVTRTLSHD